MKGGSGQPFLGKQKGDISFGPGGRKRRKKKKDERVKKA